MENDGNTFIPHRRRKKRCRTFLFFFRQELPMVLRGWALGYRCRSASPWEFNFQRHQGGGLPTLSASLWRGGEQGKMGRFDVVRGSFFGESCWGMKSNLSVIHSLKWHFCFTNWPMLMDHFSDGFLGTAVLFTVSISWSFASKSSLKRWAGDTLWYDLTCGCAAVRLVGRLFSWETLMRRSTVTWWHDRSRRSKAATSGDCAICPWNWWDLYIEVLVEP